VAALEAREGTKATTGHNILWERMNAIK
jgi:hypothetical protein